MDASKTTGVHFLSFPLNYKNFHIDFKLWFKSATTTVM